MRIPSFLRRPKLHAATASRGRGAGGADMDYGDVSEPNMKLSRALLIVLLLHVVAVSGIVAFNAVKERQSSLTPDAPVRAANSPAPAASTSPAPSDAAAPAVYPRAVRAQKEDAPPRQNTASPHSAAAPSAKEQTAQPDQRRKGPVSSGKIYTVKKGDSPLKIAKKLHVPYDDLVALNHIEDPRKLKIGQKLLIPKTTTVKTGKSKSADRRTGEKKKNK
jgi:LysM repeat protein